jgi:hypothetical protein
LVVELPDEDFVEGQVDVQHEFSSRIGLDHVYVRSIVSAEGEAAEWAGGWLCGTDLAGVGFDIRGFAEPAVGQDWENGDGASEVVGHEQEPSVWMHANIGRAGAAGTNGVEQF